MLWSDCTWDLQVSKCSGGLWSFWRTYLFSAGLLWPPHETSTRGPAKPHLSSNSIPWGTTGYPASSHEDLCKLKWLRHLGASGQIVVIGVGAVWLYLQRGFETYGGLASFLESVGRVGVNPYAGWRKNHLLEGIRALHQVLGFSVYVCWFSQMLWQP